MHLFGKIFKMPTSSW